MATQKMTRNEKRLAKNKAKKAAVKKSHKKPVEIKRRPRAQRLPGMEDAGIAKLESLANDLDDIKHQKKDLTAQENDMNDALVAAMKECGKTVYSHKGIHINLTSSEKAKVVIKDTDDTPADPEEAPSPKVSTESLAVHAEA